MGKSTAVESRKRTERGFAVGRTLWVRDDRYSEWRLVNDPRSGAMLKLLSDALNGVERSGWELRKVRGLPKHTHVFVTRQHQRLQTWLYKPGMASKTLRPIPGRVFSDDEFQALMDL